MPNAAFRKARKAVRERTRAEIDTMTMQELKNMRAELSREIGLQAKTVQELRLRTETVKKEIERRETSTPVGLNISDHALVRYMERVKGIDMLAMRAELGEIAARAKNSKPGRHGARIDAISGLIVGVDEECMHVTTIFSPREAAVLDGDG